MTVTYNDTCGLIFHRGTRPSLPPLYSAAEKNGNSVSGVVWRDKPADVSRYKVSLTNYFVSVLILDVPSH